MSQFHCLAPLQAVPEKKPPTKHKEKEMKWPPQMIMAGARTSGIARWRWGQGREDRNGLMRPEITHYLIKITAELAEILGIALDGGK